MIPCVRYSGAASGSNADLSLREATIAAVDPSYFEVLDAPTQDGRAAGFHIPATPDMFDLIHMIVHVRGGDPMTLAPQVRQAAMAVDPSLRLVGVQRVSEANDDRLWTMTMMLR